MMQMRVKVRGKVMTKQIMNQLQLLGRGKESCGGAACKRSSYEQPHQEVRDGCERNQNSVDWWGGFGDTSFANSVDLCF